MVPWVYFFCGKRVSKKQKPHASLLLRFKTEKPGTWRRNGTPVVGSCAHRCETQRWLKNQRRDLKPSWKSCFRNLPNRLPGLILILLPLPLLLPSPGHPSFSFPCKDGALYFKSNHYFKKKFSFLNPVFGIFFFSVVMNCFEWNLALGKWGFFFFIVFLRINFYSGGCGWKQ